jgi:hypothetical protein
MTESIPTVPELSPEQEVVRLALRESQRQGDARAIARWQAVADAVGLSAPQRGLDLRPGS